MGEPRFTFDRKTGTWKCNKPFTEEEIGKLQAQILVKQVELHPEILNEATSGKEC